MEKDALPQNPYDLVRAWLTEAEATEPNDPSAVCLATSTAEGRVSNRMVLCRGVDERGFVFFTNSESRKGTDMADNPYAAMCFHWKSLRRQIRVEGRIDIISDAEADTYYKSRPRGSRIGAWASAQSRPLDDYEDLVKSVEEYERKYEGVEDVPRPPYWNGYRLTPEKIEFWIDGQYRLHRRYIYEPVNNGWSVHMINP
ncbi:MAG: pyridoxamine 5'-phosphate oxidase [Micavibrio aeruginosavorus]|uniref:Pyridoxamine 5'-phosphate oxidase n=1 Tax=Micavibrio aeruginosavorus TaxID=349221 RepID=A0A2W5A278_9BACT|nr:MAG: pyridoxamine 5'-phosphate oxidase [Micavibrio aeruginosavorus]